MGLAQWRKDLRMLVLAVMALILCALPWVWYGAACMKAEQRETRPALSCAVGPCVALTFDDGPRRETTSLLLDGLERRGVHATFFVVGTRLEGNGDLLQRMADAGHQIGIHSQNHKVLAELGIGGLEEEVSRLRDELSRLTGEEEFMLRPPYGLTGPVLLEWVDCPIILWSVDPRDWSDHDVERQAAEVVAQAEDGDIILLHDIYYASVETALQVVDRLMAEGYCFVTVEELFALHRIEPRDGEIYRSLPAQ